MNAPLAGLLVADLTRNIAILCADDSWAGQRPSVVGARRGGWLRHHAARVALRTRSRAEHAGNALREDYGLPRPPNRNQERALEGAA